MRRDKERGRKIKRAKERKSEREECSPITKKKKANVVASGYKNYELIIGACSKCTQIIVKANNMESDKKEKEKK